MTFGYPLWLWALLVLPLLAFFFARAEQRGAERLQQFVAARLMPQLAGTVNRARRIFRFILLLLVFALVIVSLARPRVGYTFDEVRRKGLDLILAVDVSRSMLSNDVSPNRLERVKLATQDLINELQGDRVGLIAFAGRAFLQAPLTIDYDAAVDSINDLDTKSIPEGGTNISDAIALATRTYGKAATGNRALIIFTDGEELNGDAVAAARAAADAGVRIFTVGVGTQGGSLIPIQGENGGTAFVKDEQGQVVKSKLDETRLREIAKATNGFYLHLENGPKTMQQLFSDGLGKMKVADINARMTRHPIERYEWPLAGAIFLFAIALLINDRKRRNAVGGTGAVPASVLKRGRHSGRPANVISAALLLILVRHSQAASAGLELYDQQKFPEAYQHFEQTLKDNPGTRQTDRIEFDAGAAAYKMKDYNKAMQSFSQALLSKDQHLESAGHYNLGNTLYERGEAEQDEKKKLTDWENALQHYSETLKAEPKNKEAKDNYDYVKKKIDDLKKKQEKKPTPTPTPTPSPSPQKNQQNDKNKDKDQQNKGEQNKDQQNKNQKNQGGGTGQGQQQQKQQQTPTPTPTATPTPSPTPTSSPTPSATPTPTPSPSPGDKKQNSGRSPTPTPSPSAGNQGENSPTPTPTPGDQSPTPSNQGTPTPTPGGGDQNGDKNGQTPTPTPAGTPGKAPKGEVKGAGEEKPKESPSPAQAEAEPEKEGEMSPKQARRLLESMKDEEQKVQLDEHRAARPVYKDW